MSNVDIFGLFRLSKRRTEVVLIFGIFALAAFLRLHGLGRWELALDEYYLTQSILSVAENGFPNFPNGGYYKRGLLLQYIIAPLLFVFEDVEFAVRIVPATCNLLTIPAVYLLSKKMGGRRIAILSVLLFSLSLWEIEFARFARMYAPFQLIFMWQVFFLVKYFRNTDDEGIVAVLILAFVGIFVYAGSIFLVALGIFGLIIKPPRMLARYWILLIAILISCLVFYSLDFRQLNLPPNILQEIHDAKLTRPVFNLMLLLPKLDFAFMLSIGFVLIASTIALKRAGYLRRADLHAFDLYSGLLILGYIASLLGNQFLLATLIFSMFLLYQGYPGFEQVHDRIVMSGIILYVFWSLVWVCVEYLRSDLSVHNVYEYFVSFPDVVFGFVRPWLKAMPIHASLIFVAVALRYVSIVTGKASDNTVVERIVFSILIFLLIVTFSLQTKYQTTRYTFYLYPILMILTSATIVNIARRRISPSKSAIATVLLGFGFIGFSETYRPEHIFNIVSKEYNYRVPYNQYTADLYYLRQDYRSIAEYLNEHAGADDTIITFVPVVDHYLTREVNYTFVRKESVALVLSCEGSCYIWNGSAVLLSKDELLALIGIEERTVWVISGIRRYFPLGETQHYLNNEYKENVVYENFDESIAVYKF